jgi:hypothetical protein
MGSPCLLLLAAGLLGPHEAGILERATAVEALRLAPARDVSKAFERLSDRRISGRAALRDPAPLRAILLGADDLRRSTQYDRSIVLMSAEVAFRVSAGRESLEIDVCLQCGLLAVFRPSAPAVVIDFQSSLGPLLELAREAFPADRHLAWLQAETPSGESSRKLLGPALERLASIASGEAFGVKRRERRPSEIADLEPKLTRPMSAAAVARLVAILKDDATYVFGEHKRCSFVPNVAFRLRGDAGSVEVILCFGCEELQLNVQDPRGRPLHLSGGSFHGTALRQLADDTLGASAVEAIIKDARRGR